jgi:hypothetical protein
MPTRNTTKTKLETAQDNLREAANIPQETVNLNPTPITTKTTQTNAFGGVSLPVFEPSSFIASDLYSASSSLPVSKSNEVDQAVQKIEGQRQTLRLVQSNLNLNIDVLKTSALSEKQSQAGIGYGTERINTSIKEVGYQSSLVSLETAQVKLAQGQEKLVHAGVELTGLQGETPLRKQFWEAKLSLISSRISQIEVSKMQLDQRIGSIETQSESIE